MKNRGKGLIDLDMLEKAYIRQKKYPRPLLPNEIIIDVTNKSSDEVFAIAVDKLCNRKSLLNYEYEMTDRKCFGTWVKDDQINL